MNQATRFFAAVCLAGFLFSACGVKQTTRLDLFYAADADGFYYSRPEPKFNNRVVGGYAVLKSFLAKQTGPFLFFEGGGWFGSSPESAMTQGAYMTSLLQGLPVSAGSVTEADFTFGWPALRGIVREQKYPFLVSNLTLENKIPWPLHDYQIFTQNDIKIGVLGIISPQVVEWHKSRLSGFSVGDPVERAREMTALLREKGVDFVIVISSLGESDPDWTDSMLAAEAGDIDLILSARRKFESAEQEQVGKTWIIYPGSQLDSISHITLTFDEHKQLQDFGLEDLPLFEDQYGAEETTALQIEQLREKTRHTMTARLTQSDEEVSHHFSEESALGNLLADCLHRWAKLDGAILNSDSIRKPLVQGVIHEYDLYNTYPYGDNITFITIRGKDLMRALEASLQAKDNFPQVAGFHVNYNPHEDFGNRIKQIVLDNGRIVRPDEKYRFAVTDHILAGGFEHDFFINSLEFKNTFVEARQIMRSCLVKQKNLKIPAVGRWKKVK